MCEVAAESDLRSGREMKEMTEDGAAHGLKILTSAKGPRWWRMRMRA